MALTQINDGSRALHALDNTLHESAIVESSAKKIRSEQGLPLDNAEQKIGAFLARLDRVQENEALRDRLERHIADSMLVKLEDIPEAYWVKQNEIAKKNGYGTLNFLEDESERGFHVDAIRMAQSHGLHSWIEHLKESGDSYPTWFKVYALDGVSSMGNFDTDKGIYKRRSKGTVAPYPLLDDKTLEDTYLAITKFHEEKESSNDPQLDALIKGGNFNKIYSHFLRENLAIVPTPENPEDIEGEWRYYTDLDLDELMHAAQTTPWCISGKSYAQNYTKDGGEFYLFHLKDKDTDKVSVTAAMSIRLERGEVDEVSGLQGGSLQIVEESLMPELKQKLGTLPGGEDFILALEDNARIIALQEKVEQGIEFDRTDLRFVYEFDHAIENLRGYEDDRLDSLRKPTAEAIQLLAEHGLLNEYVEKMGESTLIVYMNRLLSAGVPPNHILFQLLPDTIVQYLEEILESTIDPELVARCASTRLKDDQREILLDYGADAGVINEIYEIADDPELKLLDVSSTALRAYRANRVYGHFRDIDIRAFNILEKRSVEHAADIDEPDDF